MKDKVLWRNRISSSVLLTIKKVNATFSVKSKGLLVGAFTRMLPAVGLATTLHRVRTILIFINKCKALHAHQGMKGLVNWLKANTVLLQQSLGGFRLHDCSELKCRPSRTASGLPRLVLAADRALIRNGDTNIMRFYLTLFNLYRVLDFKGTLKLNTITDGFKGNMEPGGTYHRVISYIPAYVSMLKHLIKVNDVPSLESRGIKTPQILKSAPQTAMTQVSTEPTVLVLSAAGLRLHGLDRAIQFFIGYFQKGTKIPYPGLGQIFDGAASLLPMDIPSWHLAVSAMGRLGFKAEAAGKVRVFAMVDAWTQWVMNPFHEFIFDILRRIPMDGTFDQMAPVRETSRTCKSAYSLDLSAATDRLPLSIQIQIFRHLVSADFAIHWAFLLVGRGYIANSEKYKVSEILHYSVGQPMGALSSWGSLALTHHFLVQAAAWDAGVVPIGTWFTGYAVLGDDLVIYDQRVKKAYLRIVDAIGVECGIAKSLLSPRGLAIEFAKRTLWKGIDISPVPLTEFVAANLTVSEAVAFARKYKLSFPRLIKSLGYGYKVLGKLNIHIGKLNSRVRALLFAYYLPSDESDVTETLFKGNPLISKEALANVVTEFKTLLQSRYYSMIERRLQNLPSTPELIKKGSEQLAWVINTRVNRPKPVWFPVEASPTMVNPPDGISPCTSLVPLNVTTEMPTRDYIKNDEFYRDAVLVGGRVVKLLLNLPLSEFRAEASDLLWDIKGLRFNRTLYTVYSKSLTVLRQISLLGEGKTDFDRQPERLPYGSDPVAMRYWRDFTNCILKVVKPKGQNKEKISG